MASRDANDVGVNPVRDPNFRQIGGRSSAVHEGDVFCMLPPDDLFLFGRVVFEAGTDHPLPGAFLVYVYRARAEIPEIESHLIEQPDLLIPPMFTNRLGWARGYWRNIRTEPIRSNLLLPRHVFFSPIHRDPTYYDETGTPTAPPLTPLGPEIIGEWGVGSYLMVDDLVSDALGIIRARGD